MKVITLARSNTGMKIFRLSLLWIAAGLIAVSGVRADIYTWTDSEGVIHFSNQASPPEAEIYMKEPPPGPTTVEKQERREPPREKIDIETIRRQAKNEARLEEANRRLDRALDKVDELTERVIESQSQATAAATMAQQANLAAQQQPEAVGYDYGVVKERVVVHYAPHQHRHKYRKPYYFGHDKKRHPHYKSDRNKRDHGQKYKYRYRKGRIKYGNQYNENYRIGHQRSFIPRAYGIR